MTDVTNILGRIEDGDPAAAEQLLPLVYQELRKLAAAKMAHENPGQTLQPTALVHEAYLRLVDTNQSHHWDSRNHFFAAAAEAMRRILVESARRKSRKKRGGDARRRFFDDDALQMEENTEDILAVDEALSRLAEVDQTAAQLVELRYFGGMTVQQAADLLNMSQRAAYYAWDYARSWLRKELRPV
jgi:RNA polymerase sigma factor (TIGR02999 family)